MASLPARSGTLTKLVDDLHQLSMSDEGALAYPESTGGRNQHSGGYQQGFPRSILPAAT